MKHRVLILGALVVGGLTLIATAQGDAQRSLPVRVDRLLEVRQLVGQVDYVRGSATKPAKVGDYLEYVGDGIATGKRSTAKLFVDTGIGTVDISESTNLKIQGLAFAADNGRITRLLITQGQARLKVRRFTHQGSRLEIRTPSGLSGVRGTDLGLAIQPNGKTGLAVFQGLVSSSAQGQSVAVNGGRQNFTIPGEPPSTPVPLMNDTSLKSELKRVIQGAFRKVQLIGQVDPVNAVSVNGTPQVTDRTGKFETSLQAVPLPAAIQVVVTTPLGKQERHLLTVR